MNGIAKEIFKYSAMGVGLLGALYIVYALAMGILNLQKNDLNHIDENIKAQTESLIRLEGSQEQQIKILERIELKL